jgi:hypothetical protein
LRAREDFERVARLTSLREEKEKIVFQNLRESLKEKR